MKRTRTYPTQQELQMLFDYDSDRGRLIRKKMVQGGWWRESPNGTHYRGISVNKKEYCHFICVWIYHHGDPGKYQVDHIDRDRRNDRIENLRLATNAQNSANQGLKKTNTSGFRGVRKYGNRWRATIYLNNKQKHLGYFSTAEEAAAAYQNAAKELHREFAGAFS